MSRLRDGGWILPVSLCVALLLGLLPLPDLLQPLRPYWLALVLAYWVIEAPDNAGLGLAVIVATGKPGGKRPPRPEVTRVSPTSTSRLSGTSRSSSRSPPP